MRETISIAVFDQDDPVTAETVAEAVGEYQSVVVPCMSKDSVLAMIKKQSIDVVVMGLQEPFEKPFGLLSEIKDKADEVEIIFLSQFDDQTLWVWMEAIQRGAYEFLPKPLDPIDLKRVLLRATEKHHPVRLKKLPPAESIKGASSKGNQNRAFSAGN